ADATGELAEVRLRVEVGREVAAVAAGVHIDDVDGVELVEIFVGCKRGIGVHNTRIEADAEDRRNSSLFGGLSALPLIVAVPRRSLADLQRILVDGRVHVGNASLDAGLQDRHVDEGGADVDDNLDTGLPDQLLGCLNICCIKRMNLKYARRFQASLLMYRSADCLALGNGARCDMNIAKYIVVLRAFVRHYLGYTAGADDKDILFHFAGNTPFYVSER